MQVELEKRLDGKSKYGKRQKNRWEQKIQAVMKHSILSLYAESMGMMHGTDCIKLLSADEPDFYSVPC